MIAYCDSSVIVRFILDQPEQLKRLEECGELVTSTVAQVECLRAIENARLRGEIDADAFVARRREAYSKLSGLRQVGLSQAVLRRAQEPFGISLKALDAIHVATAVLWRDRRTPDVVFATHDRQQARAATVLGFEVIGI